MVKRLLILIFSLALLVGMGLVTTAALAGPEGIFGEMRWRWEGYQDIDADSGSEDNWGANYLRTRLGYRTDVSERGSFLVTVENVRVLGGPETVPLGTLGVMTDADHSLSTYNDHIYLHEAHLGIRDLFLEGFHAYGGRFSLAYGRERIIGTQDWPNYSEFRFDGFQGRYAGESYRLDLLCLKLAEVENQKNVVSYSLGFAGTDTTVPVTLNEDAYGDIDLRGFVFHYDWSDNFFCEPYALYQTTARGRKTHQAGMPIDSDSTIVDLDNDSRFLAGCLFDYLSGSGLHFFAEGVLISGTGHRAVQDTLGVWSQQKVKTSAAAFYAGLFYELDHDLAPFLGVEFNYASGSRANDDRDKTFVSQFGSASNYMGAMDMVGWSNTQSFRIAGGLTPLAGMDLRAAYWIFRLASAEDTAYGNPAGLAGALPLPGFDRSDPGAPASFDRSVGTEIDIFCDLEIDQGVDLEAGLSVFNYGDYFKDPEGEADQKWDPTWFGWLGASVSF